MDMIISEILEMCGNDKKTVLELIEKLQDLCSRTNDYFEERKLLGYCECCGIPIHKDDTYCVVDGVYYCDYCGGKNGMSISDMENK